MTRRLVAALERRTCLVYCVLELEIAQLGRISMQLRAMALGILTDVQTAPRKEIVQPEPSSILLYALETESRMIVARHARRTVLAISGAKPVRWPTAQSQCWALSGCSVTSSAKVVTVCDFDDVYSILVAGTILIPQLAMELATLMTLVSHALDSRTALQGSTSTSMLATDRERLTTHVYFAQLLGLVLWATITIQPSVTDQVSAIRRAWLAAWKGHVPMAFISTLHCAMGPARSTPALPARCTEAVTRANTLMTELAMGLQTGTPIAKTAVARALKVSGKTSRDVPRSRQCLTELSSRMATAQTSQPPLRTGARIAQRAALWVTLSTKRSVQTPQAHGQDQTSFAHPAVRLACPASFCRLHIALATATVTTFANHASLLAIVRMDIFTT